MTYLLMEGDDMLVKFMAALCNYVTLHIMQPRWMVVTKFIQNFLTFLFFYFPNIAL